MNNASLQAPPSLLKELFAVEALKGHSLILKSHIAPLRCEWGKSSDMPRSLGPVISDTPTPLILSI